MMNTVSMKRWAWWTAHENFGLVVLALLLAGGYFSLTWMTGDEARYFILARAIAQGDGYIQAHLPIAQPENVTPPAYPLLLAGLFCLVGPSVAWAKVLTALLFPLVVIAVNGTLRRAFDGPDWVRLSAVAIGCFHAGLLTMSCWLMAELPFMVFTFSALWLCLQGGADAAPRRVLLIGALAVAAYYTRAAGLALLAGIGSWYVLRGKWRQAAWFACGAFLLAVPWIARSMILFGAPDPYVAYLAHRTGGAQVAGYPWARIIHDIARALPNYFYHVMPAGLFPHLFDGRAFLDALGLNAAVPWIKAVLAGSVLGGFALRLRRFTCLETFWVFYWLLVCALPLEAENAYYLYPVFPLAGFYMVTSLYYVGVRVRASVGVALAALPAAYVLVIALATSGVHFVKEWPRWRYAAWAPERYLFFENAYYDAWARFVEAGEWVRTHTEPDAVVASRKAQHFFVFSGRRGWGYHTPAEVGTLGVWETLRSWSLERPVYLIEDGFGRAAPTSSYGITHAVVLDALLLEHAGDLDLVYETAEPITRVWRVRPGSG